MPNEDRLNDSGYYQLGGEQKEATKRLEFDQGFTGYYSRSTPTEYRATLFQPANATQIVYDVAWETCPILEKIEFVYNFLKDLFEKIEKNDVIINKKIVDEIQGTRPVFDTNVGRFNEAKKLVENRGLQKDKDDLTEVEILLRNNIMVFEQKLNQVQISMADKYNELGKTRGITTATSRSGSSFSTSSERLELPAQQLSKTEGELANIKKSMDDLMRNVAGAKTEEERRAVLELLTDFKKERNKKEQELEEIRSRARVSA